MHTAYASITPYMTKDGSWIRELMHPAQHGNRNQSLAEATIASGGKTLLHRHRMAEEIYHIIQGKGMLTLAGEQFAVGAGDTISIAPGTSHCVVNTGAMPLKILCASSPAYSHEDTELL